VWPEIDTDEAARLCRMWRQQGVTSSHDLRRLLSARARAIRAARAARARRWLKAHATAKGKAA